ncbi:PREDICTED: visual pigment-like receptor peropsin [Acropora digitifera]|uniref:visual pigment-like receptor peropsin n=1 Tax=Acropora digitifera TaxID=70779 RepID=UPI00077A5A35|nr:PREDICTED: visual pigment-like receptor peropsin [Acropora digitifera]
MQEMDDIGTNLSEKGDKRIEILYQHLVNRPKAVVGVESFLCCVINIISFVGNILVLIAFCRNPRLRKPGNYYIIALAVADIILASFAMPFGCASTILGEWIFGQAICWLQAALATMLGTATLVTLALIATNRLLTVVYPSIHRWLASKTTVLISIFAAWCVTATIPLSFYLTGVTNLFHPGYSLCLFDFSAASYTLVIPIAIVDAFLPYQVIFFCYFKIWCFIRNHRAHMFSSTVNADEIRLNRLFLLIVISFTVCYTPFTFVILLESFQKQILIPREVYVFADMMVGLSCCVNPVIYGIMNPEFKREFAAILRGRKRRKIAASNVEPVQPGSRGTEMYSTRTSRS